MSVCIKDQKPPGNRELKGAHLQALEESPSGAGHRVCQLLVL